MRGIGSRWPRCASRLTPVVCRGLYLFKAAKAAVHYLMLGHNLMHSSPVCCNTQLDGDSVTISDLVAPTVRRSSARTARRRTYPCGLSP